MRRREEGGRLRNPRGRLSLGREVGGTPGVGHWWDGVLVFLCQGTQVGRCQGTLEKLVERDVV